MTREQTPETLLQALKDSMPPQEPGVNWEATTFLSPLPGAPVMGTVAWHAAIDGEMYGRFWFVSGEDVGKAWHMVVSDYLEFLAEYEQGTDS